MLHQLCLETAAQPGSWEKTSCSCPMGVEGSAPSHCGKSVPRNPMSNIWQELGLLGNSRSQTLLANWFECGFAYFT